MNVPTTEELVHLKIQAAMREHNFPKDEMMYLGERAGPVSYTHLRAHET